MREKIERGKTSGNKRSKIVKKSDNIFHHHPNLLLEDLREVAEVNKIQENTWKKNKEMPSQKIQKGSDNIHLLENFKGKVPIRHHKTR